MRRNIPQRLVARFSALAVGLGAYLGGVSPSAATVAINYFDSGWYSAAGDHSPGNQNYFVGDCGNGCTGGELRDWFVFDLAAVGPSILGAQLRLFNPSTGYQSVNASETYVLFDVSTPVTTLVTGGNGLTAIFNDLGSGTSYGSRNFSSADNNTTVSIPLNAAAVSALNASRGSKFAIAGAVTTLVLDSGTEAIFAFSSSASYTRQLVLTTTCGNGAIDSGEGCDDGNETGADGCSHFCAIESCWSCSGAPSACAPLALNTPCNDELFCTTTDACNGTGACVGSGNPCTGGLECNNVCNEAVDNCIAPVGFGCTDDGDQCTFDHCNAGTCTHPIAAFNTCADDGEECTYDYCDSLGACIHPPAAGEFCDDDLFCNGIDFCGNDSACSIHFDAPCAGGDGDADCAESCDEASDLCNAPDPLGSPCPGDGTFCNGVEQCDGNGTCVGTGDPCPGPDGDANCVESCDEGADNCTAADPNGSACTDADACTTGDQCNDGTCVTSGTQNCNDNDVCTQDSCVPASGCINDPAPAPICRDSAASTLTIAQKQDNTKDKLSWRSTKGDATALAELEDPTTTADYALCIYDQSGLVASADVPAGGTCGDKPCWKAKRGGFGYRDRSNANDGIGTVGLKEGPDTKARASIGGKGDNLPDPVLPLTGNVTVQLRNTATGLCLGDTYVGADITKNDDDQFRAKHKEP